MTLQRQRTARLGGVALALGLATLAAQAQTSPWYVGVSQRFEHQSNVLQRASAVSDNVSSTSLVGGLDLAVGRQRVFGRASIGHVAYSDLKALNHDSHDLTLGVNWETAGNLSGTVALESSRSLADFAAATAVTGVTSNNLTRSDGARFIARMGTASRFSLEAGGSTRRVRFDNPDYITRNANIDEGFVGVRYRPAGSLVLGAALRLTRGEYPNFRNPRPGIYTSEGFDKDNIDLTADWPLSGASRVDARLSIGKDKYDTLSARNFSGVTGELRWRWQPTGRSSLVSTYTRRSGDDASVSLGANLVPYAAAASRVTDIIAVTGEYDVTGKIKARAGLSYSDGTNIALGTTNGAALAEVITAANLGFVWDATRSIRAGCDVAFRNRASKAGVAGYDSTTYGCFGEFVLR